MALSEQMQSVVAELDAALVRADVKARREARFDIRQGSSVSVQDARTNAKLAKTVRDTHYWKSYASELVRQGKR